MPLVGEVVKRSINFQKLTVVLVNEVENTLIKCILKVILKYAEYEMQTWIIMGLVALFVIITIVKLKEVSSSKNIQQISRVTGSNNIIIHYVNKQDNNTKKAKIEFEDFVAIFFKINKNRVKVLKKKLKKTKKKEGLLNNQVMELSKQINSLKNDFNTIDEKAIKFLDGFQGKKLKGYNSLFLKALDAFLHGKTTSAVEILKESEIDNLDDAQQIRETRILKSRILQFTYKHDLVERTYEKALKDVETDENVILEYAHYLQERGNTAKAVKYYSEIINISTDKNTLGKAWNNLGVAFLDTLKYDESERCFNEAVKIRESIAADKNDFNILLLSNTLAGMGSLYSVSKQLNKANNCYDRAFELKMGLATKNKGKYLMDFAATLHNYSRHLGRFKKHQEAIKLYHRIFEIFNQLKLEESEKDNEHRYKFFINLGEQYFIINDFKNSERFLVKGLNIAKVCVKQNPSFHTSGLAFIYGLLGDLYYKKGENDRAEENYKKSLEINRRLYEGSQSLEESRLANILRVYGFFKLNTGDIYTGRKFSIESLNINKKLANENPTIYLSSLADSLDNVSAIKVAELFYQEAAKYSENSLEIFEFLSHSNPVIYNQEVLRVSLNLCRIYETIYKKNIVLSVKDRVKAILSKLENKMDIMDNQDPLFEEMKSEIIRCKTLFK